MNHTEEQIKKRYEELPEDIKTAISSVDTTNVIIDIGDRYNLNVEQLGDLVDETGLVMLGFTHTNEFVNNLKNRLKVSGEVANNLAKEINEEILLKIRESLRKPRELVEEEKTLEEIPKQKEKKQEEFISEEKWLNPLNQSREMDLEKIEEPIENLEREKVLGEIENPVETELNLPAREDETSVIEKKLTGIVKAPTVEKEKTEVKDPYREPIE